MSFYKKKNKSDIFSVRFLEELSITFSNFVNRENKYNYVGYML